MHDDPNALTADTLRDLVVAALQTPDDGVDDQFWLEQLQEMVPRVVGELVFSLYWDSGGPGAGAGTERVYRLAGKYLLSSASFGWSGPYDSLDEAFGTIVVTGATKEIWSSEWSEDELIARMELYSPGPLLEINGTRWPLETLEHRHAQLHRDAQAGEVGEAGAPGTNGSPELFMGPSLKSPEGDIFLAVPLGDPGHIPAAELRDAAGAARAGEAALERGFRDPPLAELRFREALDLYLDHLREPHPRLSYILDRIGLACQLQGRLAEAETFYRRSLAILEIQDGPTRWNEVTILNLAVLLGSQGRYDERDEVMELYQP